MSLKSNLCHRCNQLIYEKDKFGPVNSNIYHKSCFKCLICDTSLTLKSYATSQTNINDKEVYCQSHAPKTSRIIQNQTKNGLTSQYAFRSGSKDNLLNSTVNKNKPPSIEINNKIIEKLPNNNQLNTHSRGESRVSALTKKWNSRENLLNPSPKIVPKFTSQSNLLSNNNNFLKKIRENNGNEIITSYGSSGNLIDKPKTEIVNNLISDQKIISTYSPKLNHRPKFNIGGINYTKYLEEIKHSQHNFSDLPKRNVTDLHLKINNSARRSGSTGDILNETKSCDNLSNNDNNNINSKLKKKLNVQTLMNDELNFYESFNNVSSSLNKDLNLCEKQSTKHNQEILETMFTEFDVKTKIVLNNSVSTQDDNLSIKELSIEKLNINNDTIDENLPENKEKFGEPLNKIEVSRSLGRLLISYIYRNDEFTITIQRADDLLKEKDDHSLDTYVTMMILPDSRKQTLCSTKICKDSNNPIWNQTFIYCLNLSLLKTKYVYLSVKDHKMASELLSTGINHEALKLISLGEILISLNDVRENVYYEMWCNLKEPVIVQETILTKDL